MARWSRFRSVTKLATALLAVVSYRDGFTRLVSSRRFGVKERNRGGRVPKRYFLLHVDRVKWLRYRESSRIAEWRVGKTTLRRLQYHSKARLGSSCDSRRAKLTANYRQFTKFFFKDRSYSFTGGKMMIELFFFSEGGFNPIRVNNIITKINDFARNELKKYFSLRILFFINFSWSENGNLSLRIFIFPWEKDSILADK